MSGQRLEQEVYITDLFKISPNWKQAKCPSIGEYIDKMGYIPTMEYYLSIKKQKLLIHATIWMKIKIIMLTQKKKVKKENIHFA